jgi:hypothetical protein
MEVSYSNWKAWCEAHGRTTTLKEYDLLHEVSLRAPTIDEFYESFCEWKRKGRPAMSKERFTVQMKRERPSMMRDGVLVFPGLKLEREMT